MKEKLAKLTELLLDTGKRNNLINFRDNKSNTLEIVFPDFNSVFKKADGNVVLEVFDPQMSQDVKEEKISEAKLKETLADKIGYVDKYSKKLKKASQVLAYNPYVTPAKALRNLDRRAKIAIEENGVNIAYMAFGFIAWRDGSEPDAIYDAPVLLAPIYLSKDSGVDPYRMKVIGDDMILNPTFAYKMQSEYKITLPEYDGEDIDDYLGQIGALVGKFGWQISKECKVGLFSFLKINMYMDLKDNGDAVVKNLNVRRLLGDISAAPPTLSETVESQYNVVDADSSQLKAIEMAKAGDSFVLQGPPGTGKSQTITNIIAECLGDGKKVLFVSEKLAALDVVYSKLKQAGLEDFCLQLHSHKANKRDFIQELCRTMRLNKSAVSSKAAEEEDRLNKSHVILDNYARVLHGKNQVIGKSLYALIEEACACKNSDELDFFIDGIQQKDEAYLRNVVELIENYTQYAPFFGKNYKDYAWYGYACEDSSFQSRHNTKNSLNQIAKLCEEAQLITQKVKQDFNIDAIDDFKSIKYYSQLFLLLSKSKFIDGKLLDKFKLKYVADKIVKLRALADELKILRDAISKDFQSQVFQLDAAHCKTVLLQNGGVFARLFSKEYKKVIADIKNSCKGGKINHKRALASVEVLAEYENKTKNFKESEGDIVDRLPSAYVGIDTDWDTLDKELGELKGLLTSICDFGKLAELNGDEFSAYQDALRDLGLQLKNLSDKFDGECAVGEFDATVVDLYAMPFNNLSEKISACLADFDSIDNWKLFVGVLDKLRNKQALKFIDVAIAADIPLEDYADAFKNIFYLQWIDYIIGQEEFLRTLNRVTHDKVVDIFCDKDMRNFEISKAKIRSMLSALRPDLSLVAPGSAVAELLNEGGKKRRLKPIRTLLSTIRELAQNLKPCFLMSPLSVSTFLTPDIKFDVVVFDEASQIFPQDAIGAIYRAKQLIVVGDSKQMPPSNFFNSVVDVEELENDDDVVDFESILDMCSTVLPQLRLKWHYRSRYERLIDFSNKNFYDAELVTFPSSKVDREGIGVDFKYVEGGVFDHNSRTNRAEAEYIVDLVFQNIRSYPDRSLGVVAFSIAQQDLIERLLAKKRLQDTSCEEFFRTDKEEPFFVKNLETVQGDERDTVIFSVAYAKDKDGKMLQNFGPINKVGGERRLNVAFTRAKLNVQLVASIRHFDIDLKNSSSVGARMLRDYLDYAQNGAVAVCANQNTDASEEELFEFESQVAEFLRSKGYDVDVKIGSSSLNVDMGVRIPNGEDYILAVECDGRFYKSAKNTRDRDRLRKSVLQRMGWHYHRIWAIDWIKNKKVEKEKLLQALKEALDNPSVNYVSQSDILIDAFEVEKQLEEFKFAVYKTADIQKARAKAGSDYLKYLRLILEVEAPISEELFLKRTVRDFDREKVTDAVWEQFQKRTSRCISEGIVRRDGFMYLKNKPVELRTPSEDFTREAKYISLVELAEGMFKIISKNITVERLGLYRMLAKLLGFSKLGEAMVRRFDEALALIKDSIDINGEELSVKD